MRNPLFVLLVLVVCTSFNLSECSVGQNFESAREGEKLEGSRRASGLVPFPRIGRNADFKGFQEHHVNMDDQDYDGSVRGADNFKYADKILRDMAWLITDHGHTLKKYQLPQRIDESREFYSNGRGPRNTFSLNGYTPRLGRESDHDLTSFY